MGWNKGGEATAFQPPLIPFSLAPTGTKAPHLHDARAGFNYPLLPPISPFLYQAWVHPKAREPSSKTSLSSPGHQKVSFPTHFLQPRPLDKLKCGGNRLLWEAQAHLPEQPAQGSLRGMGRDKRTSHPELDIYLDPYSAPLSLRPQSGGGACSPTAWTSPPLLSLPIVIPPLC